MFSDPAALLILKARMAIDKNLWPSCRPFPAPSAFEGLPKLLIKFAGRAPAVDRFCQLCSLHEPVRI